MSMIEIDNMVKELGYDRVISYWYSIPIYSNDGLTKLNDDQDVIDMLVFVPETRLIDIFLHYGVDSNEDWFYSQSRSNLFVDLEADIVPNRGVVIEELDDNYGAIVPVVQTDKEKAVERESSAPIDKGKSKVSYIFGKMRARAFGKRSCKNVNKTRDKEDQRSNTVTEGLVENEVVEATIDKGKLSRYHPMKTRKARRKTTLCDDEESVDSLDSDFANPNFSCDDSDDDVNFDEWVDKQTEWVGDGAKRKEPESTNAGVESWDWGADVELDLEEHDYDNV
ncbi:hypothetical protein L3X38_035953 [Prunus dulcis]|uniref:PB1-like domain-containing protein n=1 Tax=Prunus dulcis TaxID=3755 RepID=A0AAD4VKP8_PRUDU|nr:hypothetical protein L3X38_035953 [Prunus dulcis]